MKSLTKILLISLSVLFLAGCDLAFKEVAKVEFNGQPAKSYLGGTLQFVYVENSGGMLNFGGNLSKDARFLIFTIFVGLMLITLFVYVLVKKDLLGWYIFAFILILGGGMGNVLDRIINDGKVVDFIILRLFGFHTGIFNIADVFVTVGISVLIISKMFKKNESQEITNQPDTQ